MFNWSNFDILQLLRSEPGRLRNFLLEVPIQDLKIAIDEQERAADLRYRNSRNQFQYKKNVLDMNLQDVIMECYNQNIITYFDRITAIGNTRIQNHPQYGHRLVQKCPEKYFIGKRSAHYNRAREIQRAYGIRENDSDEEDDEDELNEHQSDEQEEEDEKRIGQIEEQQAEEQENLDNQPNPQHEDGMEQNGKNSQNSQDSFIVEDEQNSEYEFIEDSVDEDELIRNRRKKRKLDENSDNQEKVQTLERTTEKKLTKLSQKQEEQQIKYEKYLLDSSEHPNPVDTSKKQQKQLKQELKKLQTISIDPIPNRTTRRTKKIEESEGQKCKYAIRKTKMILDFDDDK